MSPSTTLYDTDFFLWTQQQVALLKAGRFDQIDLDNLIEEVESIGHHEQLLLGHLFRRVLQQFLAWWTHPEEQCARWRTAVGMLRSNARYIFDDSPSLRAEAPQILADEWTALRKYLPEDYPGTAFPETCPWTPAQILDEEFFPAYDTFQSTARAPHGAQAILDADR